MGEVNAVFREERFSFQGVEYKLPRPSFESEKMFETFLEDRALSKINTRRLAMGESNYKLSLSVWQQDCAAGVYEWGSLTCDKALSSQGGTKEILQIIMRQAGCETMTPQLMNEIMDEKGNEVVSAFNRLFAPTPTIPPNNSGDKDSASPKSVPS